MKIKITINVLLLLLIVAMTSLPAMAQEITLVGEVNDTAQLVANGQIYEIGDNSIGDDLVKNYISQKVKVTGTLTEQQGPEGLKIITVLSFQPAEE